MENCREITIFDFGFRSTFKERRVMAFPGGGGFNFNFNESGGGSGAVSLGFDLKRHEKCRKNSPLYYLKGTLLVGL